MDSSMKLGFASVKSNRISFRAVDMGGTGGKHARSGALR